MFWLAVPLGLLIGASLGGLGGGGSVLTVPALVYVLGQSTQAATTGSLVIVGLTAAAGAVAHWRAGDVRLGRGLVFGAFGVAGSIAGSRASTSVDQHVLLVAFAGLMAVAAALMWQRDRRIADPGSQAIADPAASSLHQPRLSTAGDARVAVLDRPASSTSTPPRLDARCLAKTLGLATVVGLLTGFFGVGGGFVVVPALVVGLGFDMTAAVGTSLVVIAINSGVALATRLHSGVALDWPLLATVTATAVVGTWIGHRLAHRLPARRLTNGFGVLLVVLAVCLVAANLPPLLG